MKRNQTTHARGPRLLALALILPIALAGALPVHAKASSNMQRNLENVIVEEIRQDPLITTERLRVQVEDGAVTLIGDVNNWVAKRRVTDIVARIRGVTALHNKLEVTTAPVSPAQIEEAVKAALNLAPALDTSEIRAEVGPQGIVTLSGDVSTLQEKEMARAVILGVKSVTGVRNNIAVHYAGNAPAKEIAHTIAQAVYWDVRVNPKQFAVNVEDGTAILKGTVSSLWEKRLAIELAEVHGITAVDASALDVMYKESDAAIVAVVDQKDFSAAEIENAIEHALLMNPRVNSGELDAEVASGMATLTGTVNSLYAKRSAGLTVRRIMGVTGVQNRLSVQPAANLSEQRIARFLRASIGHNPWVAESEVHVSVENGTVTLTGLVDNVHEKLLAGRLAATTPGVTRIRNRLDVLNMQPFAWTPYLSHTNVYVLDWYEPGNGGMLPTDAEIRNEIQREYQWSPFVNGEKVRIAVDSGVVTLTGQVPTMLARQAAVRNALESAAIRVNNELTVKGSLSGRELAGTQP